MFWGGQWNTSFKFYAIDMPLFFLKIMVELLLWQQDGQSYAWTLATFCPYISIENFPTWKVFDCVPTWWSKISSPVITCMNQVCDLWLKILLIWRVFKMNICNIQVMIFMIYFFSLTVDRSYCWKGQEGGSAR